MTNTFLNFLKTAEVNRALSKVMEYIIDIIDHYWRLKLFFMLCNQWMKSILQRQQKFSKKWRHTIKKPMIFYHRSITMYNGLSTFLYDVIFWCHFALSRSCNKVISFTWRYMQTRWISAQNLYLIFSQVYLSLLFDWLAKTISIQFFHQFLIYNRCNFVNQFIVLILIHQYSWPLKKNLFTIFLYSWRSVIV